MLSLPFGKIWAFILLGFAVVNAVTTLVAMIKNPKTLDAGLVWEAVQPVIVEITDATGIGINMAIAETLVTSVVAELKVILSKS